LMLLQWLLCRRNTLHTHTRNHTHTTSPYRSHTLCHTLRCVVPCSACSAMIV
jgi:hypothetical protein